MFALNLMVPRGLGLRVGEIEGALPNFPHPDLGPLRHTWQRESKRKVKKVLKKKTYVLLFDQPGWHLLKPPSTVFC